MSVIPLREVLEENRKFRLDAEFFSSSAREAFEALRGHRRFVDLVASGYRVIYENTEIIPREEGIEEGLPFFLQAADIETPFIRSEGMGCVGRHDWERYRLGRIVPGEVLIEVKGLAEKVALVDASVPTNTLVTGTCYKLQTKDPLDSRLLIAFLASRHGQALKNRLKSNLLVAFISKDDLFSMPVPRFGEQLKKSIAAAIDQAFELENRSKSQLAEAEQILVSTLHLRNWAPDEPLSYSRSSAEVFAAWRIDAEYYHPSKRAYIERLHSYPGAALETHYESVRDMFDPKAVESDYLLRNFDLTDALQPVLDDLHPMVLASEIGSIKKRFSTGDVVISRLRSYLRQIAVVQTSAGVGSSEFVVLRPRIEKPALTRAALLIFLRSHPVQTILKWSRDGSQHPRFGEEDLMSIPVPDVVCANAPRIDMLFEEMLDARSRSRMLLERARLAVEVAIDESEEVAIAHLRECLSADS